MTRPGEFELIERYFARLSGDGAFGLKDDAALLGVPPDKQLVVTQDAIAAGVHFFRDDPPDSIARKALRVNLSDLASKGARPVTFSMALGLPSDWREDWLSEFARGLAQDCSAFSLTLCGGDTFAAKGGPVISIAAFGFVEQSAYASRLGAAVGDQLFVTGRIGEGALGLAVRKGAFSMADSAMADLLLARYLVPEPPIAFASVIARFASASMDISDGFVGDLEKLALASGVGFDIPLTSIPLSPVLATCSPDANEIALALTGGDDYQFLFTVPDGKVQDMLDMSARHDIQVTNLAVANPSPGAVSIIGQSGEPLKLDKTSWRHF